MDTEASLKQYLSLQLKLPAGGPDRAAGQDVRLRGLGRARGQGDRHRRQAVLGGQGAALRHGRRRRLGQRPHRRASWPPPRPSTSWCRSGSVRQQTGWMLDILERPGHDRAGGRGHAGGDAGQRDDRADRPAARARPTSTWPRSWSTGCCPSCSAAARRRSSTGWRRRTASAGSTPPSAARPAPLMEAARLTVTMRRSRTEHLETAAGRRRSRRAAALRAVPVLPRPRPARHPPARRRPVRGAGLLMAAPATPESDGPARDHRGPARGQGDRDRLRVGRRGQDHDGGGRGRHGRRPARRQGARGHRRSGPAAGQRPRAGGLRQRREAGPDRGVQGRPASGPAASCGRPCSTPSRAGTTWCAATPPTRRPRRGSSTTRCTRTSPAGSCRATTTSPWSGSTRSTPRATST